MSRFDRTLRLFKASLTVMTHHRRLLVFPLIVAAATFAVALLFLLPVGTQQTGQSYFSFKHWWAVLSDLFKSERSGRGASAEQGGMLTLIHFAAFYFTTMAVATFCNVAFYHEILKALKGETVSVRDGIQFAISKWRAVLLWTLLVSAVGVLLRSLEKRASIFGQITVAFVGVAWSVASVFAIPVLIHETETLNPFKIVKKSAATVKKVWGESLIGYVGVSIGSAYVAMFSIVFLGGGIYLASASPTLKLLPIVIGSWLLMVVSFSLFCSVASKIFRCALFVYATEGNLPAPYNKEMMATAWKWAKN